MQGGLGTVERPVACLKNEGIGGKMVFDIHPNLLRTAAVTLSWKIARILLDRV